MLDTYISPLVLTKIRVPAIRLRLVTRPHLLEMLESQNGERFTLVSAPAGYGKTTLLKEWAQVLLAKGMALAWYSLDTSDDAPIPFSAYLIGSLLQALGDSSELQHLQQLMRTSPEMDIQKIVQLTINAILLSKRDSVLILDDYHLISSPKVHLAVAYLLEHLPENMRVVIGSRTDPPLPLGRMRVRGDMLEIRMDQLCFTESETEIFLNDLMQLFLSGNEVFSLRERTEGWIAGLQLAALSLSGRDDKEKVIKSFSGSSRLLKDYLFEEVFARQTREEQTFLLTTSILERMCVPLCEVLLSSHSGSGEILKKLEQANLFVIALDEEGIWYRYHHLFGEFLRNRLDKEDPGRIAALHRAASEWLAAHQLLREAAQHAFQTGDWAYAAAFVEQHSFNMLLHSEISTIHEWCMAFPEEVLKAHPMLCILQCWGLVFSFRKHNRPKIEARLQLAEQSLAIMQNEQRARELAEHAAVVRAFLEMAPERGLDVRAHLARSQRMLGTYSAEDVSQFSALLAMGYAYLALHEGQAAAEFLEKAKKAALSGNLYYGVVESTFNLACLAYNQGKLERTTELCKQNLADIATILEQPEKELPAVGCLYIGLGCVLLEQNQLGEAEIHLRHGLDLIGTGRNTYYLMMANISLARLYEAQGRKAEALSCLNHLEEIWPDILFCTEGLKIRLLLQISPDEAAIRARAVTWSRSYASMLAEESILAGMGPLGAAEVFYLTDLTWMRVQIHLGEAKTIWPMIENYLIMERSHGLKKRVIELGLLYAQAAYAEDNKKAAWSMLEEVFCIARTEGFLRIFDQGKELRGILAEAASDGICPGDIKNVLMAVSGTSKDGTNGNVQSNLPKARSEKNEYLSRRELEVLDLMAAGATNQDIADQLVITIGTVKSHLNHILRKLEARNRTEAVARARELGLFRLDDLNR